MVIMIRHISTFLINCISFRLYSWTLATPLSQVTCNVIKLSVGSPNNKYCSRKLDSYR